VFARYGLAATELYHDIGPVGVAVRVLGVGSGQPLVMLHGVTLAAAIWAPWLGQVSVPTMFCWGTSDPAGCAKLVTS
jgi:hypothetical protein